jgi:hypothetical protein
MREAGTKAPENARRNAGKIAQTVEELLFNRAREKSPYFDGQPTGI